DVPEESEDHEGSARRSDRALAAEKQAGEQAEEAEDRRADEHEHAAQNPHMRFRLGARERADDEDRDDRNDRDDEADGRFGRDARGVRERREPELAAPALHLLDGGGSTDSDGRGDST